MTIEYEKISDNEVKKVESDEKTYNVDELKSNIDYTKNKIDEITYTEYPSDASEDLKKAIDNLNEEKKREKETLEGELISKEELLEELEKWL